jgi:hypothetical protein
VTSHAAADAQQSADRAPSEVRHTHITQIAQHRTHHAVVRDAAEFDARDEAHLRRLKRAEVHGQQDSGHKRTAVGQRPQKCADGVPADERQGGPRGPEPSGTLSGYWSPQYIFSVYIRPSCTVCAWQGPQVVLLAASCISGRSTDEMHPRGSPHHTPA